MTKLIILLKRSVKIIKKKFQFIKMCPIILIDRNLTHIETPLVLMGMLAIEDISFLLPKLTAYFALIAGSSKQGKALLASVGWNCVTAIYLKKGKFNIDFTHGKMLRWWVIQDGGLKRRQKWRRRLAVYYWIAMLASSACHNQMEN